MELNILPTASKTWLYEKRCSILLLCILIMGAVLRFFDIDRLRYYNDTVHTLLIISESTVKGVWEKVINEYPCDLPLFYVLLHLWSKISKSPFWLRAFSALWGILVIYASYRFAKYLFDRRAGLVSSFLVSISPYFILYSRTKRYYILMAFIILFQCLFLIRALRSDRKRDWISYIIFCALGFYINYSQFLYFIPQCLFIIIYRREYRHLFKKLFYCFIVLFILWLPLSPYFIRDFGTLLNGEGFQRIPSRFGFSFTFLYFIFAFGIGKTISIYNFVVTIPLIAINTFFIFSFIRAFKDRRISRQGSVYLILILFTTSFICSVSNYNFPHYILASAACYLIILSVGIIHSPKKIAWILLFILLLIKGYGLYNLYFEKQYHRLEMVDDWDKIAEYVESQIGSGGGTA